MDPHFGTAMGGIEANGRITALASTPRVVVLATHDTEAEIAWARGIDPDAPRGTAKVARTN